MAEREPVEVTVEIGERETVAGTLWIHQRGGQSATFRYSDAYLADPVGYALDPGLPKSAGVFRSPPGAALFRAFADSAPDRWGESDAPRGTRTGPGRSGHAQGARQSRLPAGQLTIAKFPRAGSDEWDVTGWEEVQLRLARRAGITVEESQLLPVAGRHVLLTRRFDRHGRGRTGFASAFTILEAADGEQRTGSGVPCSLAGRGRKMQRSAAAMRTSLMLASRRRISPSSVNSHSSLP